MSHQNGSLGAVQPRTVRATEAFDAITDHRARSARGVAACTRSTHSSLAVCPAVGGEAVGAVARLRAFRVSAR